MLSIQQCATTACLLDVTIPKPGNVHRGADFEDATFLDFALSAVAIGPAMERARSQTPPIIGQTVFDAISATREVTDTNTNLGIVLLLAPIATVANTIRKQVGQTSAEPDPVSQILAPVLASMTPDDSRLTYEAIGLAQPGGIEPVKEMDVRDRPPESLIEAMSLAADRDLVARQFVTEFAEVCQVRQELLERIAALRKGTASREESLRDAVILTFVNLMHRHPDSLIARKCGREVADESSNRAAAVLQAADQGAEVFERALSDLDFWLRSDGNQRNPGTTADLVTAAMFLALVENRLQLR